MSPTVDLLAYTILALAGGTLLLLVPFAVHRTYLLLLAARRRPELPTRWVGKLPHVTVQLPVYNEAAVVERLIDAACSLEYPCDRLEIQVLDDSTDGSDALAEARVSAWRAKGTDVHHIRRTERTGFKAGALSEGLLEAKGEFLLVLDADFVPHADLLHRLLPPFEEPGIGMVQARWDHLNERENLLTRVQAFLLDGHFFLEHGGRFAAGRFFNFNGTAGMWRRRCLEDAGGWEADTLTEDLDLSYRAQMRGWRFGYLEDVGVPAELPAVVGSLEGQQRRWAQGGIQTARKVLPELLRGEFPGRVKVEAIFHLCGHLAHPLTLLLGILIFPSAWARQTLGLERYLVLDLAVFAAATLPFLMFYGVAGRKRSRSWRGVVTTLPLVLATGIGLTASVAGAVLRGLVPAGGNDPFLRTPKQGAAAGGSRPGTMIPGTSKPAHTALKLTLATWMWVCIAGAVANGFYGSLPFLLLFASGWTFLGVEGVRPIFTAPASGMNEGAAKVWPSPQSGREASPELERDGKDARLVRLRDREAGRVA